MILSVSFCPFSRFTNNCHFFYIYRTIITPAACVIDAKRLFCLSLFCTLSLSLRAGDGCDTWTRRLPTALKKYSGEIYKEATFGGSEIDGQPTGDREGRIRIDLPASRRKRDRLEGDPGRHHARELHQQHRVQLLYRGHNVSTAASFPSLAHFHSSPFWLKVECNNNVSF